MSRAQQVVGEVRALREWLWLNHGCPISTLYGDDGEKQCTGAAHPALDFNRDDLVRLVEAMKHATERERDEWRQKYHNDKTVWCEENDRLRALLREVEWGHPSLQPRFCPVCKGYRYDGHARDCRLAAALKQELR